jgi:hypothetical protein
MGIFAASMPEGLTSDVGDSGELAEPHAATLNEINA